MIYEVMVETSPGVRRLVRQEVTQRAAEQARDARGTKRTIPDRKQQGRTREAVIDDEGREVTVEAVSE